MRRRRRAGKSRAKARAGFLAIAAIGVQVGQAIGLGYLPGMADGLSRWPWWAPPAADAAEATRNRPGPGGGGRVVSDPAMFNAAQVALPTVVTVPTVAIPVVRPLVGAPAGVPKPWPASPVLSAPPTGVGVPAPGRLAPTPARPDAPPQVLSVVAPPAADRDVDPVTRLLPVIPQASAAVDPVVDPVTAPVPVVEPVVEAAPIPAPADTVVDVVDPVTAPLPVVEPVVDAVPPVVDPVADQAVTPVVEPVVEALPDPVETVVDQAGDTVTDVPAAVVDDTATVPVPHVPRLDPPGKAVSDVVSAKPDTPPGQAKKAGDDTAKAAPGDKVKDAKDDVDKAAGKKNAAKEPNGKADKGGKGDAPGLSKKAADTAAVLTGDGADR
jgi:hypothetical protein